MSKSSMTWRHAAGMTLFAAGIAMGVGAGALAYYKGPSPGDVLARDIKTNAKQCLANIKNYRLNPKVLDDGRIMVSERVAPPTAEQTEAKQTEEAILVVTRASLATIACGGWAVDSICIGSDCGSDEFGWRVFLSPGEQKS